MPGQPVLMLTASGMSLEEAMSLAIEEGADRTGRGEGHGRSLRWQARRFQAFHLDAARASSGGVICRGTVTARVAAGRRAGAVARGVRLSTRSAAITWTGFALAALLAPALIAPVLPADGMSSLLDWRPGLALHQPWRWWSAAWVHLNGVHLAANAAGTVLGALIVAAPSLRLQDRLDELEHLAREEAATISRSLGYRAPA